jgi:hypothetical protein
MFASRSLTEHLLRGAVGLISLAGAAALGVDHLLGAAGLVILALAALRGCPTCWTVGLVQTVLARGNRASRGGRCVDGSCALRDQ